MSSVAPAVEPVVPARTSGLASIFEHTRYVLGENRVTAFAFGLLLLDLSELGSLILSISYYFAHGLRITRISTLGSNWTVFQD